MMDLDKQQVHAFWNEASCGETLYLTGTDQQSSYRQQAQIRYQLEPYIIDFAGFGDSSSRHVLEIGVGLGADHQRFAEAGALLKGCDLTPRAVRHTQERLACFGLPADVQVADAEALPYATNEFDLVYSWGVIHHSPDTPKAVSEIHRVLKPGGEAAVMIYHTHSFVGYMLWVRYAFLTGRWTLSLADIYARFLESPGTKAYTLPEAEALFSGFSLVTIHTVLTHGDLLSSQAGQRHAGTLLTVARRLFPRKLIQHFFPTHGLFMLIKATK